VGELVGVDSRSDGGDLAAGDLEADDGDQSLLRVEIERAGTPVDLRRPYLDVRDDDSLSGCGGRAVTACARGGARTESERLAA
jgi:hypothetical protein